MEYSLDPKGVTEQSTLNSRDSFKIQDQDGIYLEELTNQNYKIKAIILIFIAHENKINVKMVK